MEQILFESDKNEAKESASKQLGNVKFEHSIQKYAVTEHVKDSFKYACSYKNNQMQEFLSWCFDNGVRRTGGYRLKDYSRLHEIPGREGLFVFSELFEIFIKETSK